MVKGFTIFQCVDIFFRIVEKIKSRITSSRIEPFCFVKFFSRCV